MPEMDRATACGPRPAALTTSRAPIRKGFAPPVSITSPGGPASPRRTNVSSASIAPCRSASPSGASMKAWLSTLPVDGESNARSATSAGSSPRASGPLSQTRSVTPLASACASNAASLPASRLARPHDQLAAALVRHRIVAAEIVQHRLAVDAEPRLGEAGRIINAGMDHLDVARTDARSDRAFALDHDDLPSGARQRPGDREPDDASADDEMLYAFHWCDRGFKVSVRGFSV